ncbi:hypothetical protein [Rubellicoccus peritrichatus]|uniref:Uncharacterized protein n=1 Tax=Rubellicoccus peritrichatus TaxID=3080537 RepID=A0AAQ3LCH2_9BACT|nr:hypothetical protein [Puniceicoccus sp. CR14]WOO43160.1 hypothetical protein RZN69_08645 [Puniceicoccus sp. CR14]
MPRSILIGNHLFFAREGDSIDGVTVARDAKPDTDPEANWTDVGIISSASIENSKNELEIWGPSPGRLALQDVLLSRQDLMIRATLEEASPMLWELLFGAVGAIDTSGTGAFVPLAKRGFVKGWWKFQQYDQNDVAINLVDVWGRADITGAVDFGDQQQVITYELEIRLLNSALNSGVLSNII